MERESSRSGNAAAEFHDWPDEVLLVEYVHTHDERLFGEIVERHKRMIEDVCCRVLHHRQDVEDAAQQTWLVLWRKAASILKGASLKSWLHGAAKREARNVLRSSTRWSKKHKSLHDELVQQLVQIDTEVEFREALELLTTIIGHLVAKYRVPIVLCCLGSKGKREVAQELGLPEGTVASRVRKARNLLRRRLGQRGVVPPSKS